MESRRRHSFATTRWSVVARVQQAPPGAGDPEVRGALEELCADYWYPLYAFVRRQGHDAELAQDLVQGFFAQLLEKGGLAADAQIGRFRHYLLGAMRHYLANETRRESARKRGGGVVTFSLGDAEARFAGEPSGDLTPEAVFERRFALTVLERARSTLEAEYRERGREQVFRVLQDALSGDGGPSHAERADALGISESAVKVAVHRMRRRMGELLRLEVADTVAEPGDVEDELRGLFEALGAGP